MSARCTGLSSRRLRRWMITISGAALASVLATAGAGAVTPLTSTGTASVQRAGRWITDRQGRVVVMHGVNIVKKVAPYYPNVFSAKDAEFLADEGFTAARIGFIWAGVEPEPGVYDNAYIKKILGLNNLLARYGIHTLIDVHQDSYTTQGPDPVRSLCADHGVCYLASGDGAPQWATLGSSADAQFQAFWDNKPAADGVGIQTRFVNMWRHIVPMLKVSGGANNVIGLDPFNEPYPGSGYSQPCGDFSPCPAFEKGQLHQFYQRVISAMRGAGYRGMIWPEGIADSGSAAPSLPAFSDPQVAFNWHYYCTASQVLPDSIGLIAPTACAAGDASAWKNLDGYTATLNVPWMVSEFGGNDSGPEYAHEVALMGSRFTSWMYWMYYNAALEPANSPFQGLLANDSAPGSVANARADKLQALVIPYAQAIAGTPVRYNYNALTKTMTLTYRTAAVPGVRLSPGAQTQIFVPSLVYPTGYKVRVTGAAVTSRSASPWVHLLAKKGAKSVTVAITPTSGGHTDLPSQTSALPK